MLRVDAFFRDIDARWSAPEAAEPIALRVIGSTALMLQADYGRGTKDSDVLETDALSQDVGRRLLALAGPQTAIHERHRIYIDIVAPGIPFLPRGPTYRSLDPLNAALRHFRIEVLDVVDVVVSKLKRFSPNDIDDISAMVDRDLVEREVLVERFRAAVDVFACDARAEDLPKYVKHLHRVERDLFGAGPSEIELPGWIADESD